MRARCHAQGSPRVRTSEQVLRCNWQGTAWSVLVLLVKGKQAKAAETAALDHPKCIQPDACMTTYLLKQHFSTRKTLPTNVSLYTRTGSNRGNPQSTIMYRKQNSLPTLSLFGIRSTVKTDHVMRCCHRQLHAEKYYVAPLGVSHKIRHVKLALVVAESLKPQWGWNPIHNEVRIYREA